MKVSGLRRRIAEMLAPAGISINGPLSTDIQVRDLRWYGRVVTHGSVGLGESYMDGWWDCDDLDGMFHRLLRARVDDHSSRLDDAWVWLKAEILNLQRGERTYAVGRRHYDIGNDLFRAMLGSRLVYSCGYWAQAETLDAAQEAKLDLVCRKLHLAPGMRVLDIGCGWAEALKFAAQRYGVEGFGITISVEQAEYARELCRGLPIEIRVQDYRELDETFDRVFSIGMFEHVGLKNYPVYFETVRRCLREDGLSLLHCIGGNTSVIHTDPWIEKYIFPNSMIPSAAQIASASESRFVIEDWHGFGPYYDRTLIAWRNNFDAAWPQLSSDYDERFKRMWHYYLSSAAAGFRARRNQLWQLVMSPNGVPGGYEAVR